jgi:hypothetical protein
MRYELSDYEWTAIMDPFVVPTIGFDPLYAFAIVRIDRRDLVGMPRVASCSRACCEASVVCIPRSQNREGM